MSEVVGAVIGLAISLGFVLSFFLGRIVQMNEDHRLEKERLQRWGVIK